jgi:hypothetical protein
VSTLLHICSHPKNNRLAKKNPYAIEIKALLLLFQEDQDLEANDDDYLEALPQSTEPSAALVSPTLPISAKTINAVEEKTIQDASNTNKEMFARRGCLGSAIRSYLMH